MNLNDINRFLTPLSVLSKDKQSSSPNQALIDDETKLLNFDGITKYICHHIRGGVLNHSCDAYFELEDVNYFIEFKNQKEGNIDCNNLKCKAYDSMCNALVFKEQSNLSKMRESSVLIVVYNKAKDEPEKNYISSLSFDEIAKKLSLLSGNIGIDGDQIKFGLKRFEGELYEKVYTLDVSDFKNYILPKFKQHT